MSASDDVLLKVKGQIYSGWKSVVIDRALGSISGSYDLSVTEQWPGSKATYRIAPGDACQLAIGDTTLITGWVDDANPAYDSATHGISVKGRDKTCDLVDCSAIVAGGGAWNNQSVMAIARQLLAPYGISIRSNASNTDEVMGAFAIQMGESVWECLERALRLYGVTAMPDGQGNILVTVPGAGPALAEMKLGGAILSASGSFSGKDTYSDYWIVGQFPGSSDVYVEPSVTNGAWGYAKDPTVTRYRPLIVSVECNTSNIGFLPTRALWEAARRAGAARVTTIRTQGWRDANGTIYEPNTMMRIEDDFTGIHESLLVYGVKLSLDEPGQIAELKCARLSGSVPAPLPYTSIYENSGATK